MPLLERIPWEIRVAMREAPEALIEPTTSLVTAAINRLQEGEDTPLGKQCTLWDGESLRYLDIASMYHEMIGGVIFLQVLANLGDTPEFEIQLPYTPEEVTLPEIYLLRGITPESMAHTALVVQKADLVKIIKVPEHPSRPMLPPMS